MTLPDSVKRVRRLASHPATSKQQEKGLARRTVYVALGKLRDLGMLCERLSLSDTRQTVHWLCDSPS